MKITQEGTPATFAFVQEAANYRFANAAWGDGKLLDAILQIIEKIIPLIPICFPAKPVFVENVMDLTNAQLRQLHAEALRQARRVPGLKIRDHRAVAEAAYNGMLSQLESMNEEEVSACYDELIAE